MRSTVGVEEASWSADLLAGRTIGPRSTFGRDPGARSRSGSHLPGCHALDEPMRRYPSTLCQSCPKVIAIFLSRNLRAVVSSPEWHHKR